MPASGLTQRCLHVEPSTPPSHDMTVPTPLPLHCPPPHAHVYKRPLPLVLCTSPRCCFISPCQAAVDATWSNPNGSGISIVLDNTLAQSSAENADRDPANRSAAVSQCLFVQAFRSLSTQPARALRSRISDRGVLFQVGMCVLAR